MKALTFVPRPKVLEMYGEPALTASYRRNGYKAQKSQQKWQVIYGCWTIEELWIYLDSNSVTKRLFLGFVPYMQSPDGIWLHLQIAILDPTLLSQRWMGPPSFPQSAHSINAQLQIGLQHNQTESGNGSLRVKSLAVLVTFLNMHYPCSLDILSKIKSQVIRTKSTCRTRWQVQKQSMWCTYDSNIFCSSYLDITCRSCRPYHGHLWSAVCKWLPVCQRVVPRNLQHCKPNRCISMSPTLQNDPEYITKIYCLSTTGLQE